MVPPSARSGSPVTVWIEKHSPTSYYQHDISFTDWGSARDTPLTGRVTQIV